MGYDVDLALPVDLRVVDLDRRAGRRAGSAVLAAVHADLGDDAALVGLLDALPAGAGLLLLVERVHADGPANHQRAVRVAVCRALRRLESAQAARLADVVVSVAGTEPAVEHVDVPVDDGPGDGADGGKGASSSRQTRTVAVRLPDRGAAEAAVAAGRSSRGTWVRDQRALAGPMRPLHTALRRGQVTAPAAAAAVRQVAGGLALDDVDDERAAEHGGLDHSRRAALAEVLAEQAALHLRGRTPSAAARWAEQQVAALRVDELARRAAEDRARRRV